MTKDIRYFQGDKSRRWGSINEYSSPEERSALDRFKADFEASFFKKNSVREMYAFLKAQNEKLVDFVEDPFDEDFRALDDMPHCLRQLVKDLAVILYDIRVDTRGKNDAKYSVIVRTEATRLPDDWKEMASRRMRHGLSRICWNEWIAYRRIRDDQVS
jgi:hypothetical protein